MKLLNSCTQAPHPLSSVQEFGCGISFIILVVCRYHGRQADYSTGSLHSSVTNRFFLCLCFKAIAITLAFSDTIEITIIQPDSTYMINRPAETSLLREKRASASIVVGTGSLIVELVNVGGWGGFMNC